MQVEVTLMQVGLSVLVVQTIQAATVESTPASYRAKWLGFQYWCVERRLDGSVLSFPQHLLDSGLSHATIMV